MDDASGLAPGKQLGKYRLDGLLGRGGMGEVWAAHDPDLDRKVALKVLRAAASGEDARLRLLREGRAMARLRHTNVITVYEATAADGRDVIAMELIEGESLAGWLAEHREPDAIVATLIAAGRGLAAAHAAGMIHRDFKPHNVLVDRDGRVVVTDFGLARALGDEAPGTPTPPTTTPAPTPPTTDLGSADTVAPDATLSVRPSARAIDSGATTDRAALHSPLTRTGALLGTPAYMAPEQLAGQTADARSDQYAFCVTAWEALAGTRPFVGATFAELRDAVDAGVPVGGDKVPARLRPLLARGLAHDPADRWPTIAALLGAIERAWRRPRRIKIIAAATVGAIAIAAVPIAMWLRAGTGVTGPCPGADQAFGPANAAALRDAATALTGLGPSGKRFATFLGAWQTSWTATYHKTCAAPHSSDFLARRACLDSARDNLVASARMVGAATDDVLAGVDPAAVILMPDGCLGHPRALAPPPPTEPGRAAEVARVAGELVRHRSRAPADRDELAAIAGLVEDARRTDHAPLIADALLVQGNRSSGVDPGAACAAYAEALAQAEKAGGDLLAIDALLGLIECGENVPDRRPDVDALIERASNLIERIDARPKRALLDHMHARRLGTGAHADLDAAIAMAEKSRLEWVAIDAPIEALRSAMAEAEILVHRGRPEDLHHGEVVMRAAIQAAPPDARRVVANGWRQLGEVLWWIGRLDEAVAILSRYGLPAPAGELDVVVHVVASDGTPAQNASVAAAVDPVGDPIRLIRGELDPMVTARTDDHGTATVHVPRGAVVLAELQSELGGAAPTTSGELTIKLGPTAYIDGSVAIAALEPPPADARAGQRLEVMAGATIWIDGHPWSRVTPIARDGRFHLALPPGRAIVEVEGQTGLGDQFATVQAIELVAGSQKVALEVARPVALRVIARPATAGLVVVAGGGRAIKTWADVTRAVTAGRFAVARPTDPVTRANAAAGDDVAIGDMIVELAAPGPGPVTVCVLPGADTRGDQPVPILALGPQAAPPVCVPATAVDGVTTTVMVPTRR